MTPKQFVIRFFFGSVLLTLVVGLINRIVDPFLHYRDIEITGFNKIKPDFQRFARQIKSDLLVQDQPEAIIFGSSISEIGFDPNNTFFTDHGRLKGMNFAFAGLYDVQCHFEFVVAHAHIRRALVEFEPSSMPVADCEKRLSLMGRSGPIEFLLSSAALKSSISTIFNQKEKAATHTREGMFFYFREDRETFPARFSNALREPIPCNPNQKHNHESKLDLGGLKRMIGTAKKFGIELVLVAPSTHAYSLELRLGRSCGTSRWQAIKQVAGLIEAESPGSKVRAWDFYNYNDTTAEPVGKTTKYWQDTSHFNFEMGDLMLEDMFGRDVPKFGRPIVSGNVEADYQEYLLGRAKYLQRHPKFQADLQKLLLEK